MHVEIFKGTGLRNPGWYVRLIGANGKTLNISESYVTRYNARRAAKKVFPTLVIVETET